MAVQIIDITDSLEWAKFRGTGVGASEVPSILGLNPFKSQIEIFFDKVGFRPKPFINLLMLTGKITESLTSDIFECYNGGTVNETAMNIQEGRKFRTCKKLPTLSFIKNDLWENTFVSPDREFSTNTILSGSLEIKDSNSQFLSNQKGKYAITHKVQLLTQMAVWEKDHGCLAYLIDRGRDYKEFFFERDGFILNDPENNIVITEEDLKIRISDFWTAVVIARDATHKMQQARLNFNMEQANQYQAVIDSCEPEIDPFLSYELYLKENYYSITRPRIEIQGTEEHERIAEDYIKAKEVSTKAQADFQLQKNKVLNVCKLGHAIRLSGKGIIEVNATKVGQSIKVKL